MALRIKYVIPEDGDDIDHPNVFTLTLNTLAPTLLDIKKSFPVPGRYYFRFLKNFENMKVWIDLSNDSDVIPSVEGQIFAKIRRIEATSSTAFTGNSIAPPKPSTPNISPSKSIQATTSSKNQNESSDRHSKATANIPKPKTSGVNKPSLPVASLLDDGGDYFFSRNNVPDTATPTAATLPATSFGFDTDLLDVSIPVKPTETNKNLDLLGLDSFQSNSVTAPQPMPSSNTSPGIQFQRSSVLTSSFGSSGSNSNLMSTGSTGPGLTAPSSQPTRGVARGIDGSGSTGGGYDAFSGLGSGSSVKGDNTRKQIDVTMHRIQS